jgi:hypothetical protein
MKVKNATLQTISEPEKKSRKLAHLFTILFRVFLENT